MPPFWKKWPWPCRKPKSTGWMQCNRQSRAIAANPGRRLLLSQSGATRHCRIRAENDCCRYSTFSGLNLWDTAYVYGMGSSETELGKRASIRKAASSFPPNSPRKLPTKKPPTPWPPCWKAACSAWAWMPSTFTGFTISTTWSAGRQAHSDFAKRQNQMRGRIQSQSGANQARQ